MAKAPKDRAHDVKRVANFATQPSPWPPMSMSNDVLGHTFTAAQKRDEAADQLHNEYKLDAAEGEAERAASHAADKETNLGK